MTATDQQVARCLDSIRAISTDLANRLTALSVEEWDGPTNCPPWPVRELATHIVTSGEGFVASIRRGLAGSVDPPAGHDERQRREAELESAGPQAVARALQSVTHDFESLYQGLSEDQLETICYHRRGNRSLRWYSAHRLAEVAFHSWDLNTSLSEAPTFSDSVAVLLLPTLLESNAPRTYAAGLSQERGNGERFSLQVTNDPSAIWHVTIHPDRLEVLRDRGCASVDLRITTSAANLALLVYGRLGLPDKAVETTGDPALVDRFTRIFPRP